MSKLFAPAMWLMDRLRFPGKFMLLLMIVLVPLLTMAGMLVNQFHEQADLLESEHKGLLYVKALRAPLEHIQQHRGMTSAYKNGATQFKERILSKRQEIDGYINELTKIDAQLTTDLQTQGMVGQLVAQWESIKAHAFEQDWPTTLKAHNALIADILSLFNHVNNTSGIVLDSKLDSSHLGIAITEVLPKMTEYMGQTRATASGIAASGSLNPQTLAKLLTLISNVETYADHFDKSFKVATRDNANAANALNTDNDAYKQSLQAMLELLKTQILNSNPMTVSSETVFDTSTNAITASFTLYAKMLEQLDQLLSSRSQAADQYLFITLGCSIFVILAVIYLLVGLSLSIHRSVNAINTGTKRLAANDFTVQVDIISQDELREVADNFNAMTQTLSSAIRQVISTSADIQSSAGEVYEVAFKSHKAVERQRQETTSVASAITEMSASIQEVARTTQHAADATNNADTQANQSKVVVATATLSIGQLAEEIEQAANVIQRLEADSQSIGSVLDAIKSIADQTNLLALNAAIEAARAGDQGRGFAVVSDEVRTLAGRTQESTTVIESMITKLQSESRDAVKVMQRSCQQANQGVEHAQETMRMLEAIMQSVTTINAMNLQIASAAEQQTAVTEEINRNIIHISEISQQTSAGSEQTTNAANHLHQLANNLQTLLNQFRIR